ncbi:ribbon-helix-helix protein, CopG family [Coraliomargarita sinensis]
MEAVSVRIEKTEIEEIDRLAYSMEVDRTTIIRRLISVGVEGLLHYEKSAASADWPRKGRLKMRVTVKQ